MKFHLGAKVPIPVAGHLIRDWRESRGPRTCVGGPTLRWASGVRRPGPSPRQAAPHAGPPPAPLPLPRREEETRRPSPGLRTAAAASPAPLHPARQLGRPESRPRSEVSGDGGT